MPVRIFLTLVVIASVGHGVAVVGVAGDEAAAEDPYRRACGRAVAVAPHYVEVCDGSGEAQDGEGEEVEGGRFHCVGAMLGAGFGIF